MGGCLWRGKTCSPRYGVLPSYPVGRVSSPSQLCCRPGLLQSISLLPYRLNSFLKIFVFHLPPHPFLSFPIFFLSRYIRFFLFFSGIHLFPSLFRILSLNCRPYFSLPSLLYNLFFTLLSSSMLSFPLTFSPSSSYFSLLHPAPRDGESTRLRSIPPQPRCSSLELTFPRLQP